MNVANTTIGASNLTFRSISANGAVNAIVLNTTVAVAGLLLLGILVGFVVGLLGVGHLPQQLL